MATQRYRIVSRENSDIHDEPHIEGSRVTVWDIYTRIEKREMEPGDIAESLNLDIADVYEALAYYHRHPKEMEEVRKKKETARELAKQKSDIEPPG